MTTTSAPDLPALLADLQLHTAVRATGRYDVAAFEMPLTHRCGPKHVIELLEALNEATTLVPGEGSANREALGIDGQVHQWLGPCAYPETGLIFIWEATQDDAIAGGASPWDAGGLLTKGTVGRSLSTEEAVALINTHSVALPAGRAYLGAVLECSFAEPGDYLEGRTPQRWYPGWAPGTVPRDVLPAAHTFEARRPEPVPVFDCLVAAVVDEAAFADAPRLLRKLRRMLAAREARFEPCRPQERCDAAARRVLWQHLRDRGAL